MSNFFGLRCIYPFLKRLCYIIKTKHSETNEISDFLVLIESYIHCLALRRQNEPSIVALQGFDNIHVSTYARCSEADLKAYMLGAARYVLSL